MAQRPIAELDFDDHEISVRDLKTGAILFAAPRSTVTCRRGLHRYKLGRAPRFEHAVLDIEAPGRKPLSIGSSDIPFTWESSGAVLRAPRYVVCAADLNALARALGAFSVLGAG